MKNKIKLIISLILLLLCVASAILNEIGFNDDLKVVRLLISLLVAVADMFLSLIPCIFTQISITSSQIDPNKYSYNSHQFVDREVIFNDITNQIASLDETAENIMWIRLYGEDGIGKKTLVSKLFQKYKYPFNKFYFIEDEERKNIFVLLNDKYPLNNTSIFNEALYMHSLEKSNRAFVIMETNSNDLNERVTSMLTKWYETNLCKHKLIFITLDRTTEQTEMNNQTVVFEYKLSRLVKEDSKKLVSKLLKQNCFDANAIVQASDGHPAAIKTLCNFYLKAKEQFECSNWIDAILRLKNDSKKDFLDFCILSIVRGSFEQCVADEITNAQTIEFLISSNLLVKNSEDRFYIPMWLVKTILISEQYNEQLIDEVEGLNQKSIFIGNEKQQIIALVNKQPNDILGVLNYFRDNRLYTQLKEFYSKLNIELNSNDFRHKQIMIIIMDALLKLGDYGIFRNNFIKFSPLISAGLSDVDYIINLLIADYYHLTSQYEKSNEIYYMLSNTELASAHSLEIQFHLAHNFRHMGKFKESEDLLRKIEEESDHDNIFYIRSVTARISIDYFKDNSFDYNSALSELRSLSIQKETEYNVYRHIANIYRRTETGLDAAIKYLNTKISELQPLPLRIVYDYYFDLAECYRQLCRENISYYNDAIKYYNHALIFAESNHDINLKLCAQFGKALVFYQKDKNRKQLHKSISILLNEAKISYVIYYAMLTIIDILNNDNSILPTLTNLGFNHYIKVLESKEINSLYITVM